MGSSSYIDANMSCELVTWTTVTKSEELTALQVDSARVWHCTALPHSCCLNLFQCACRISYKNPMPWCKTSSPDFLQLSFHISKAEFYFYWIRTSYFLPGILLLSALTCKGIAVPCSFQQLQKEERQLQKKPLLFPVLTSGAECWAKVIPGISTLESVTHSVCCSDADLVFITLFGCGLKCQLQSNPYMFLPDNK